LQTFQHNPSIKNRTEIKAFVDSAKGICPLSMDEFPPNFVEDVFHSVSKNAFYTPNSRSLIDENYNPYSLNEIALKLNHDKSGNKCNDDNSSQTKGSEGEEDCEEQTAHEVTENEFINAADLAQK
jgi:Sec7-like guanine-nucleotide exchange factor